MATWCAKKAAYHDIRHVKHKRLKDGESADNMLDRDILSVYGREDYENDLEKGKWFKETYSL